MQIIPELCNLINMKYLSLKLPGGQTIESPRSIPSGGIDKVGDIFKNAYTILLIITVVLSIVFIIFGGIQWITSGGDKGKVDAARKKVTWAVIGLIVAFASFLIVGLIGFFFDVNLLDFSARG